MTKNIIRISLGILCGLVGVGYVLAAPAPELQLRCGNRALVGEALRKDFNETPVAIGLALGRSDAKHNKVLEVFSSPEGSWTLTLTDLKGQTCLIFSGEAWENLGVGKGDLR